MNNEEKLEDLAMKYRGEGYDVKIHPDNDDLPSFLADTDVILLAHRDQEYFAIHPPAEVGADFRTSSAREPEPEHLQQMLVQAERLNVEGYAEAALLMAWSATEAALRQTVRRFSPGIDRGSPRSMIDIAHAHAAITDDEKQALQSCWSLRITVAHGFRPVDIPHILLIQLIDIGEKLIAGNSGEKRISTREGLAAVHYGASLTEEDVAALDDADRLLSEILRGSSSPVQAEWERADDVHGNPIIILRLMDQFGAVTGTFDATELGTQPLFRELLRRRFRQLWGDLLQIRSHEQLKQLELELSSEQEGA